MRTTLAFMALLAVAQDAPPVTTVNGTVKLKGDAKNPKVSMTPDCAALHEEPMRKDDIVVDKENNVRWAFVRVKKGLEGKSFTTPRNPVVLDQKHCRYEPRVFGIMAGQPLLIRNGDGFLHNVHGLPFANREWNIAQQGGQENTVNLPNPEPVFKIKCEIHPWMTAWAGVLDQPYFAVTDASGRFEIKGLPPGKYTLEVWHEKYKSIAQEIDLKETATADFTLEAKKE